MSSSAWKIILLREFSVVCCWYSKLNHWYTLIINSLYSVNIHLRLSFSGQNGWYLPNKFEQIYPVENDIMNKNFTLGSILYSTKASGAEQWLREINIESQPAGGDLVHRLLQAWSMSEAPRLQCKSSVLTARSRCLSSFRKTVYTATWVPSYRLLSYSWGFISVFTL